MVAPAPDPLDVRLRTMIDAGEIDQATDVAIRAYGPELVGWLTAMLPSETDAHEAFSWMSEELWKSLVRYDGRCSLRTWCFMLGRHAVYRLRSLPRHEREELVSQVPSVLHAATHVWNSSHANAARAHDIYTEIRLALPEEDQALLVLRVDKDLAWRDIALVLLGELAASDELTKKAASLRKQFERVKGRLRELAAEKLVE